MFSGTLILFHIRTAARLYILRLSLLPEESLSINGSIVIRLSRVAGVRTCLAIESNCVAPVL